MDVFEAWKLLQVAKKSRPGVELPSGRSAVLCVLWPWSAGARVRVSGSLVDLMGGTVPYKAIFCGDIPLHRPYIGLIYDRYLQFRILKWPLIEWLSGFSWLSSGMKWVEIFKRTPIRSNKHGWSWLTLSIIGGTLVGSTASWCQLYLRAPYISVSKTYPSCHGLKLHCQAPSPVFFRMATGGQIHRSWGQTALWMCAGPDWLHRW